MQRDFWVDNFVLNTYSSGFGNGKLDSFFTLNYLNHPLDQFEISYICFYWDGYLLPVGMATLSNFTLILLSNICLIRILYGAIVDNSPTLDIYQYFSQMIYNLIKSIMKSNTSLRRSQYFSVLLFLFLFIFVSNMVGLIPYSFTLTSSFVVTFFLALTHFNGINIIGIFQTKWKTWSILLPSGVPLLIMPFLTLIEIVSYVSKVFSLSIRLFANMMAGHALLKILIGFAWVLLYKGYLFSILGILPWIVVTIICFLELLIAFLQAYVFTILVTIYINDILNWH